jgi:altronate hydrolase
VSLVEIVRADNSVIRLSPGDNVGVARVLLSPDQSLSVNGVKIVVHDAIPPGHKVALLSIKAGAEVRRYGQVIGRAKQAIEAGNHVHTHNLLYEELSLDYEFPEGEAPRHFATNVPTFQGYLREDGRAGTRNYVAIIAASYCASHVTELIARSFEGETLPPNVDGVIAFPNEDGCGQAMGPDIHLLQRALAGLLNHPNVSSAVIVGLGCEVNQISHYLETDFGRSGRIAGMTIQSSGGTRATVEAGRRQVTGFIEKAAGERRVELPASKLVVGLNCGGSDSFSGITANPALGVCSDLLAGIGGTPVLGETPEIFGAEHLLVRRARNRQVAEKLLGFVQGYKQYLKRFEASFDDNPSPGNKDGGLTNILEKSLGAIAKGGTSALMEAVDYSERIDSPGLVFMNTPGYDPVSLTGLAAGGVNAIAFTTGRGSVIGFPSVPVIKIVSNTGTYRRMSDNMDINAGSVADGDKMIQEVGQEIFAFLLRVASGERTASERFGHKEFMPWRIGPVM